MSEVEIKLFGVFRKYVPSGKITVRTDDQSTAFQVKKLIHKLLREQCPSYEQSNLVFESVLATEEEVLAEQSLIGEKHSLALLPPVCGG